MKDGAYGFDDLTTDSLRRLIAVYREHIASDEEYLTWAREHYNRPESKSCPVVWLPRRIRQYERWIAEAEAELVRQGGLDPLMLSKETATYMAAVAGATSE